MNHPALDPMRAYAGSRLVACGLLAAGLLHPAIAKATPETGKPAYTVFMGVDLQLQLDKKLYRVEDVVGSYFKIKVDGKEQMVSTRDGSARMRIDNSLKLAGTPLEFEKVKVERAYTPGRDPHRQFEKNAGSASGAEAYTGYAAIQSQNAAGNLSMLMNDPSGTVDPTQIAVAQNNAARAAEAEQGSYFSIGSDLNSAAYHEQQLEIELAKENFDAIEISLNIASPLPLDDPYILVIARIHERDTKPGVLRNWIFAQKLDPVGAEPQKVFIKQGGFPVGYAIEDYQVRIYNHGREVPNNLSPKRVDLTREEAKQYAVIEHLAAHKEDTMAAMPIFSEAPADLKSRLSTGEYSQPFYVKVDADGNATGTFSDRDCSSEVDDPYVTTLVANVLFAPALDKGKPVPGVARVLLGKLQN